MALIAVAKDFIGLGCLLAPLAGAIYVAWRINRRHWDRTNWY